MNFRYGFSFYPEHCRNIEEIKKDIMLIKESGANTVRLGEFAWDVLEPTDGNFDFDWLEDIINELGKNGIMTVLCTPTACPPVWLYQNNDIYYVNPLGYKKPFGSRRHYCPTAQAMRFYSARIAEEMSKRFGKNQYVYGWQIDNELAHNATGRCRCESCTKRFQNYLRTKFNNNISELNSAFGTYFWAGRYSDFEQILPPSSTIEGNTLPKYNPLPENPSLRLEFEKFSSDMMVEFMDIQVEAVKRYSDKPVTTNSTGLSTNNIDYFKLYKNADRYGIDNYPSLFHGSNGYSAVNFAAGRGCKDGDFWVMEFSIGGGHTTGGGGRIQPYPGAIEQNVVYAYAAGASMVLHFQYKAFRSGAEQLNYALLDTDRVKRRRYFEFNNTANVMAKLSDRLNGTYHKKSRAAIILSYPDMWAISIKPLSTEQLYMSCLKEIFYIMNELNIAPEIISPNANLEEYDLIFTPMPVTMADAFKNRLKAFVNNGGTVVTTAGTAIKDECNLGIDKTFPGGLTDLYGVEVQEVEPIFKDINDTQFCIDNKTVNAVRWIEELKCTTAQSIATIKNTYRAGKCTIAKNKFGNGYAYYMGTFLEHNDMKTFIKNIAEDVGIQPEIAPVEGTDILIRTNGKNDYIFIFNYLMTENSVTLDSEFKNILTGDIVKGTITLAPKGYICITKL